MSYRRETEWEGTIAAPLILVGAAALIRISAFVLQGAAAPDWDSVNFARTAASLLAGDGYVGIRGTINAVHAPLYPLLLAALGFFGANAVAAGYAVSIVAGALLTACCYGIASRLFDRRTALLAAAIVAVHPALVALSTQMLADQLGLTLTFAGTYYLLRWLDSRRIFDLAVCGTSLGLAYLARPEALLQIAVAVVTVAIVTVRGRLGTIRSGAALLAPVVLLATPYIVFLWNVTGTPRVEAKTPVNYAIGVRMQRGMSYAEAADGLGPGLREDGADLGDGFYFTHTGRIDPTLLERLSFAYRELPHEVSQIARRLSSLHYGTPVFALLAFAGVLLAFRTRRGAVRGSILLACVLGSVAALASVAQFWDRYAAPFAPYSAIFGAAAIALAVDRLRSPALRRVARGTAAAIAGLAFAFTVRGLRADALDPRPLQATGAWIAAHVQPGAIVESVTPLVAFYSGDRWNALPYADTATAAAYVRKKHPTLVVLEPRTADRPFLGAWRLHGIPDAAARLVYRSPGSSSDAVLVYALP